ncbi:MAG: hypothetical protein E7390_06520 [Ruminococcaceae bacterium]|nr:hypothetical protein [Oscillospiraceae bacterium]
MKKFIYFISAVLLLCGIGMAASAETIAEGLEATWQKKLAEAAEFGEIYSENECYIDDTYYYYDEAYGCTMDGDGKIYEGTPMEAAYYNLIDGYFGVEGSNSYIVAAQYGYVRKIGLSPKEAEMFLEVRDYDYQPYILPGDEYDRITPPTLDGYVVTQAFDGMLALFDLKTCEFVVEYGTNYELAAPGAWFDAKTTYALEAANSVDSRGRFRRIRKLRDGVNLLALQDKQTGKCGYVDAFTGEVKIPFVYDGATRFSDGLASVQKDGLYAVIDAQGNLLTEYQYALVYGFENGISYARINDRENCLIDKTGQVLLTSQGDSFYRCGEYYITRNVTTDFANLYDRFFIYNSAGVQVAERVYTGVYGQRRVHAVNDVAYHGNGLFSFTTESGTDYLRVTPYGEAPLSENETVAASGHGGVLVDGEYEGANCYNIDGYNYVKLRDIAALMRGTKKPFEVEWDEAAKIIRLTTGKNYTPLPGEDVGLVWVKSSVAVRNDVAVSIDGVTTVFAAYNIDGYNYFRLRDLGKMLDFGISWDEAEELIIIDSASPYREA